MSPHPKMENTRHNPAVLPADGSIVGQPLRNRRSERRECHKCPRNGKGDDYCWKVCLGPADDSRKGLSTVQLGGIEDEGEFIRSNLDDAALSAQDGRDGAFVFFDEAEREARNGGGEPAKGSLTPNLSEETERSMVVVISKLFSLSDIQLCILKHLLFGEDYATIGRTLPKPMSKEAVQKHLVAMKGKCGFVAGIMRGMQIRGEGGAKRKQAYNLELAL